MATLVADCPRCGANKMTHDVRCQVWTSQRYNWQNTYEVACHCRNCLKTATFIVVLKQFEQKDRFARKDALVSYEGSLNLAFAVDRYISCRDEKGRTPPEHLPDEINAAFNEGAACLAIGASNAAACMFRLCVDLATRPLLPNAESETKKLPNEKQRRDLGLRLAWLFDNDLLPNSMRDLAKCIREDANDGAHLGNLKKEDALDLVEFTERLLHRLITEPKELELASQRREARRKAG